MVYFPDTKNAWLSMPWFATVKSRRTNNSCIRIGLRPGARVLGSRKGVEMHPTLTSGFGLMLVKVSPIVTLARGNSSIVTSSTGGTFPP